MKGGSQVSGLDCLNIGGESSYLVLTPRSSPEFFGFSEFGGLETGVVSVRFMTVREGKEQVS